MLLGMGKFNRVLDDRLCQPHAVVQPGVTNLGITKAVEHKASTTRPIPPRRSPARSAAMSRKIPAACTA
jgi:hypothetical protein